MRTDLLSSLPTWAWLCAVVAAAVAIGAAVFLGVRHRVSTNGALLSGALTALAVVYAAVLGMNAEAQMTWGHRVLGLQGAARIGVPATLDGLSIAVGLFAAWLARMKRNPRKAWLIVWACTLTSSYISATQGRYLAAHPTSPGDATSSAAVYLGVLAILVMLVFHLIVEQTHPEAGAFHGDSPRFGLRWLTKAVGENATLLLWLDWKNTPPVDLKPSVANAIAHRENVLRGRRERRDAAQADTLADLRAALADESARRVSAEAEASLRATEADGLRAALAEASAKPAREAAQKPARQSGAGPARGDSAQSVAEERAKDDRAKVALIRAAYTKHRMRTGEPLSRYAVQHFMPDGKTDWGVQSTQAVRILAILDNEFAEANDETEREGLSA